MISAVLFDLDGTLLDINLETFLARYFGALGPVLSEVTGLPPKTALAALEQATSAMFREHLGRTNRSVFNEAFESLTGTDLSGDDAAHAVETFYSDTFPALKDSHGPIAGAATAVAVARVAGLRIAVATNPIFPRAAVLERLRWAGFGEDAFDLITTYETAEACKPLPEYFAAVAAHMGVDPRECLMVGDDAELDLPACRIGMQTYYVGKGSPELAQRTGSLKDLAALLEAGVL